MHHKIIPLNNLMLEMYFLLYNKVVTFYGILLIVHNPMNYQSNLVVVSGISHDDIDLIANFCSFQDTLKSKIKLKIN